MNQLNLIDTPTETAQQTCVVPKPVSLGNNLFIKKLYETPCLISPKIVPIYNVNNIEVLDIDKGSHHMVNENSTLKCATELNCPINLDPFPNQSVFSVNKISVSTFHNKINYLNPNLSTHKLSRYIFPRINPPDNPEWYKDDRKSTEKMMDIICNRLGLLSNDEYLY